MEQEENGGGEEVDLFLNESKDAIPSAILGHSPPWATRSRAKTLSKGSPNRDLESTNEWEAADLTHTCFGSGSEEVFAEGNLGMSSLCTIKSPHRIASNFVQRKTSYNFPFLLLQDSSCCCLSGCSSLRKVKLLVAQASGLTGSHFPARSRRVSDPSALDQRGQLLTFFL